MAVKNTQIYEIQISGKWICKSKKSKVNISATPKKNSDTGIYHYPQGVDKLIIPPFKGED